MSSFFSGVGPLGGNIAGVFPVCVLETGLASEDILELEDIESYALSFSELFGLADVITTVF